MDTSEMSAKLETGRKRKAPPEPLSRIADDERPASEAKGMVFPEIEKYYSVVERIGAGTYATVWRCRRLDAVDKSHDVAIKRFKPVNNKPSRILSEFNLLRDLGGKHNVVNLETVLREGNDVSLGLTFFAHDSFKDKLHDFDVDHTIAYLTDIFEAVAYVHECGIVHRDIKPSNALYSFAQRKACLVDFGLAERVSIGSVISANRRHKAAARAAAAASRANPQLVTASAAGEARAGTRRASTVSAANVASSLHSRGGQALGSRAMLRSKEADLPEMPRMRGGTRGFRAPEILLGVREKHFPSDVWSVGIILLCILSRQYPFFAQPEEVDQIYEVALVTGSKKLEEVLRAVHREIRFGANFPKDDTMVQEEWCDITHARRTKASLDKIPPGPAREGLTDLLKRCLEVNHEDRITAEDAHKHLLELRRTLDEERTPPDNPGTEKVCERSVVEKVLGADDDAIG